MESKLDYLSRAIQTQQNYKESGVVQCKTYLAIASTLTTLKRSIEAYQVSVKANKLILEHDFQFKSRSNSNNHPKELDEMVATTFLNLAENLERLGKTKEAYSVLKDGLDRGCDSLAPDHLLLARMRDCHQRLSRANSLPKKHLAVIQEERTSWGKETAKKQLNIPVNDIAPSPQFDNELGMTP